MFKEGAVVIVNKNQVVFSFEPDIVLHEVEIVVYLVILEHPV